MKEEDFDEKIKEIIEKLNQLHDDSDKAVGFVLICGYEDELKNKEIQFRVAGAGETTLLALMMYVAARDDKKYSMIFDAAIGLGEEKKEQELIPFKLLPTINKSFDK